MRLLIKKKVFFYVFINQTLFFYLNLNNPPRIFRKVNSLYSQLISLHKIKIGFFSLRLFLRRRVVKIVVPD